MRWERSTVREGVEESREVNVDNSGKVERREVRLKEKDGVGDRIRKYSINVRVIWGNKVIVILIDIVMLMFIFYLCLMIMMMVVDLGLGLDLVY